MVPPIPMGVSEQLGPFLSVGDAGPSSPATFTPLEGITCSPIISLTSVPAHLTSGLCWAMGRCEHATESWGQARAASLAGGQHSTFCHGEDVIVGS